MEVAMYSTFGWMFEGIAGTRDGLRSIWQRCLMPGLPAFDFAAKGDGTWLARDDSHAELLSIF